MMLKIIIRFGPVATTMFEVSGFGGPGGVLKQKTRQQLRKSKPQPEEQAMRNHLRHIRLVGIMLGDD